MRTLIKKRTTVMLIATDIALGLLIGGVYIAVLWFSAAVIIRSTLWAIGHPWPTLLTAGVILVGANFARSLQLTDRRHGSNEPRW